MCHIVLLLPVFGLVIFLVWPLVIAGPVYAIVLLLSGWMYYFFYRQMHRPVISGMEALQDRIGEVVEVDGDELRVRLEGEIWDARSSDRLQPGDRIRVTELEGMRLIVMKEEAT